MESLPSRTEVVTIMNHVNKTWQQRNPRHGNHFWNRAVYHVGNIAAYEVAKEQQTPTTTNISGGWMACSYTLKYVNILTIQGHSKFAKEKLTNVYWRYQM